MESSLTTPLLRRRTSSSPGFHATVGRRGSNGRSSVLRRQSLNLGLNARVADALRCVPATFGDSLQNVSLAKIRAGDNECPSRSTLWEASWCVVNLMSGMGTVMSAPYLFRLSGVIAAVVVSGAVAVSFFTAWLLGLTLEDAKRRGTARPDFGTVGADAFGAVFGYFLSCVSLLDAASFGIILFIIIGVHAPLCIPALTPNLSIGLAAVVAMFLDRVPDKVFAWIHAGSTSATMVGCGLAMLTGLSLPEFAGPPPLVGALSEDGGARVALSNCMTTFSVIFSGCAFQVYYAGIFNAVDSRESYNSAVLIGSVYYALLLCAFGLVLLWMFGEAIQPLATGNIGHDFDLVPIQDLEWMSFVIGMLGLVKGLFTLKSAAQPLTTFLVDMVPRRSRTHRARGAVGLVCYATLGFMACFLTDAIIELQEVTGLLIYSLVGLIVPCLCYLRTCAQKSLAATLGAVAGATLGSAMFLGGIVANLQRAR